MEKHWAIILAVMTAALAIVLLALIERWWIKRSARRIVARIIRDQANGVRRETRLMPESSYVVQLSDSSVTCTHPTGSVERVEWNDLWQVEIVTTSDGPFAPDVFWLLHGSNTGCAIPQGATGDRELLERLQRLPGFRNEVVIEAMSSTEDRRFLCWDKGRSDSALVDGEAR